MKHMSPRLFKKLCKWAAALMLRIEPGMAHKLFASEGDEHSGIWHGVVCKGTLGFGGVGGGESPEWSDEPALDLLLGMVFWSGVVIKDPDEIPEWPEGTQPRTWVQYRRIAIAMAEAAEAKRCKRLQK